ncbi:MAG: hypothetical protein ACOZBV_09610 [Pseudomonadota bacterium]
MDKAFRVPFLLAGKASDMVGLSRLVSATHDRLLAWAGEIAPEGVKRAAEYVKAGIVSDYGLAESYKNRKIEMRAAQAALVRRTHNMVEALGSLTRAESRIAYNWMQAKPDTAAERVLLAQLPEASRKILGELKTLISDLGKEAVRLGQLSAEAYERNNLAYLHRTYAKHVFNEEGVLRRALNSRAMRLRGEQYKGRGLFEDVAMDRIAAQAPEWWGRKLKEGQADKGLKGAKFIRFERRDASGTAMEPLPGMESKPLGKLREVVYWPASEPVPAKFSAWVHQGVWEVRDVAGGKVTMWRDLTQEERQRLGELDEVRYAVAKTLQLMIHDVELGRFFDWVAGNFGRTEPEGDVVEASENLLSTYAPGSWVRVPESTVPGTTVKRYGALAGIYVPGPVWNDIRQTVPFTLNNPLLEAGRKFWHDVLGFWKTNKTARSIGTHVNNIVGNFIMADWHDLRARDLYEALRVFASQEPAARALYERFQDSGALHGMFMQNELGRKTIAPLLEQLRAERFEAAAESGNMAKVLAIVSRLTRPVSRADEALKNAYSAEDEIFRLAVFLKALRHGHDDAAAGKLARDAFLNYEINAPWIQALRSTVLPFIAFPYRALPMLLETARTKPWKLAKLMAFWGGMSALGSLAAGDDPEKEERLRRLLPKEKQGRIWGIVPKMVRMPWNHGDDPVYLDIRRFVPVGDIVDTDQGHGVFPVPPMLNPGGPVAMLFELLLNKSGFTGKELVKNTDTAGEKVVKMADYVFKGFAPNLPVPNPVGYLLADEPGQMQTWGWTGIERAVTQKEGIFGEVRTPSQAVASAVGFKVATYPRRNLEAIVAADLRRANQELDENIRRIARAHARLESPGLEDVARRDAAIARQVEKKRQAAQQARERLGR